MSVGENMEICTGAAVAAVAAGAAVAAVVAAVAAGVGSARLEVALSLYVSAGESESARSSTNTLSSLSVGVGSTAALAHECMEDGELWSCEVNAMGASDRARWWAAELCDSAVRACE